MNRVGHKQEKPSSGLGPSCSTDTVWDAVGCPQGGRNSKIAGHLQLTLLYLPTKFGDDWTWGSELQTPHKQGVPKKVLFGELSTVGSGVSRTDPV